MCVCMRACVRVCACVCVHAFMCVFVNEHIRKASSNGHSPHIVPLQDHEEPLAHSHFTAEGEVTFKSILFVPKVRRTLGRHKILSASLCVCVHVCVREVHH